MINQRRVAITIQEADPGGIFVLGLFKKLEISFFLYAKKVVLNRLH